jgi:hypothetical protein
MTTITTAGFALAVAGLLMTPGAAASAQNASGVSPQPAAGQSQQQRLAELRRAKAQNLTPAQVTAGEAKILELERIQFPQNIFVKGFHGFRPVLGGMPSGSGYVAGGGYVFGLDSELFTISTDARFSTRSFKQADIRATFPTGLSGRPVQAHVNASYQDYPGLRFFGFGNDSDVDNKVFFGQKNTIFGGGITAESQWVNVGIDINRMTVETGPANRDPSVETVFALVPGEAPLFTKTDYNVYGGYVRFKLVDHDNFPRVGLDVTLEGWRYADQDLEALSFSKIAGTFRLQVPLGNISRRLAFKLRTSHATPDTGHSVPVYLMETIGGSDTIRGYDEYRFRDTRNLLVTVEYRWEVWHYADLAVFYDGGKVFREAEGLNFQGLHSAYGAGIRVRAPEAFFFNIDVARSREGIKVLFGGGPVF